MAFATTEQASAVAALLHDYGAPDRMMIEHTDHPYGVLWLRWHTGGQGDPLEPLAFAQDRNLFIRPDGSRMSWDLVR